MSFIFELSLKNYIEVLCLRENLHRGSVLTTRRRRIQKFYFKIWQLSVIMSQKGDELGHRLSEGTPDWH